MEECRIDMADIELVRGEFGDAYVFTIFDKNNLDDNGAPQLISFSDLGITEATFSLSTETDLTNPSIDARDLTIESDSSVSWFILGSDIPATGNNFWAIINMGDGSSVLRKTNLLTVKVQEEIG